MTAEGWLPSEGDVQLRIWLAGVGFNYAITAQAARHVIEDWAPSSGAHWN
ncbi:MULTISPECIES: hypothetical protein [Nocardia]|nr:MULTISPECIES: hypothetical protein [Nocardia]